MVYIRYHHIRSLIHKEKSCFNLRILNTLAYTIGLLACFGISIVVNFQVIKIILIPFLKNYKIIYKTSLKKETNVNIVHLIGAGLAFFGLYIYLILQTIISQNLSHVLYSTKIIFVFRLVLIIVGLIFVILSPVYGAISTKKFNGLNKMKWLSNDGVIIY